MLFELRRDGRVVRTEPRVFDLIAYLLSHRDRVVSKNELLDALWPGEAVSESVLPRCVVAARRAVGDDRRTQRIIQTVHGRGYRFIAALKPDPEPEASPGRQGSDSAPFVGRDSVMERLKAHLGRARNGAGSLVLLAGEPGIGKTRTARELGQIALAAGFRVLQGRGTEAEGAPAFWLWIQILRAAISSFRPEILLEAADRGASDIARLVPEMPLIAGGIPSDGESTQARFRLFESVGDLLVGIGAREPLLLILDDLQWMDADSLLLLHFLAPRLQDAAIVLVGTYRNIDVRRQHALTGTLAALAREYHCERLELPGLERDAVESLMASVAGVQAPASIVDAVKRMTDGNPFFVRELTRMLVHEGRLEEPQLMNQSLTMPQGVRDVIGRRLDLLSESCNEMLRAAAALSRDFGVPLLERVCGLPAERLLPLIEEALSAQILVESSLATGQYSFTHVLQRQTLYLEISASQRLRLHREIGLALEQAYGARIDDHVAELAYHFVQAAPIGEIERAVNYCERAGKRAHRNYAYEEAARHYELGLEVLDLDLNANDTRRCELVLALGEMLMAAGDRERGRARFGEAAELSRALGRWDLFGRSALGHRGMGEGGSFAPPDSAHLLEEALERLGEEGDPALRARLLSKLVQTPPHWTRMDTRERLSQEAHGLAVRCGDGDALVEALEARWWACLGPDRLDDRMAVAKELLSSPRGGDPRVRMLALGMMRGIHLMRGEFPLARRAVAEYSEIADEIRQPLWRFFAAIGRASLAIAHGEFHAVESLLDDIVAQGRGTVPYAEAVVAGHRLMLRHARGDEIPEEQIGSSLSRIATYLGGAAPRVVESGVVLWMLRSGRSEEVRDRYEALVARNFKDFERNESWLLALSFHADIAMLLDDSSRAEQIDALIAPYADLFVTQDVFGAVMKSVASVRSTLALTLGCLSEAIDFGEEAEARESAAGLVPALLWTRSRLADAFERRGRRGDAARARELRAHVQRGAREIGSRHDYRGVKHAGITAMFFALIVASQDSWVALVNAVL